MSARMRRVNEALRAVLSEAIPELKDPRVGFVTVTGVETTSDLKHATVYVSVLGSDKKRARTLEGLEAAHGVLQGRLARELRMKRTPQLAFQYDPSVAEGVRMSKLIDELQPDDE
jgi:ribosome-binding factor A